MVVKKVSIQDVLRLSVILAILVFTIFPIYWMIVTSLKPTDMIMTYPPVFQFDLTFDHYRYAFENADFLQYIKNTLIATVGSVFIVIVCGTLASYSFARYNVGRGTLMYFILSTRMMPAIAVVLPFFVIFRTIGSTELGQFLQLGQDRIGTLIICYSIFNLPFAIWLMLSFFQNIPTELEDSARLDGYTRFKVFRKIVLPLAAPGIAVAAIFSLLFSWNEFLFASVLTRSVAKTITVGVGDFWTTNGILWGPLSAAATVCVLPMLVFALILQRWIVRGLSFGSVRG